MWRGGSADASLLRVQVIDGHYPHVMPHSSNLSFWEKGMTSDIGHTWLIGATCLGLRHCAGLLASLRCVALRPCCCAAGWAHRPQRARCADC